MPHPTDAQLKEFFESDAFSLDNIFPTDYSYAIAEYRKRFSDSDVELDRGESICISETGEVQVIRKNGDKEEFYADSDQIVVRFKAAKLILEKQIRGQ